MRYARGHKVSVYTCPHGRRNEALDVRVYAYAALQGLRSARVDLQAELDKRRGGTEPKGGSPRRAPPSEVQHARAPDTTTTTASGGRRRLFLARREGWVAR